MLRGWLDALARRWDAAARGRFGGSGRLRAGYSSIAVVVGLVLAAFYTLPWGAGPRGVPPVWRVPQDGPSLADGTDLPVFCTGTPGPPLRCGIAQTLAGERIGFVSFGETPDPHETLPVLASADVGLLWALADPAARAGLQVSAADVATQMVFSLHQVTDSETWRHEYRDSLRSLLDRATQQAWRAEDTQRAFRALLHASEPVVQDSIAHDIGPAMAPYVSSAFWGVVKANTAQVLSLISGGPLDLSSIGTTLSVALQDRQVQTALGRLGPRVMDLPESELLTERLAANMADALQRDPATTALLTRIALDPRLGNQLGNVRGNVAEFMHRLGRVLWGLGGSSEMNSLAGLVMRSLIVGESRPLILVLKTDDAATLMRTLPGRVTLLVPEEVP